MARWLAYRWMGRDLSRTCGNWLEERATATDRAFPANKSVRIEKNEPIITRAAAAPLPEGLAELEALLAARMAPISVLNALADTARWLGWTRFSGPISGFDAKIDDPLAKYAAVVFCYGSNIGPAQFAKSYDGLDRRQIAWINQRHSTEETLDKTIACVVDGCRRFTLPRCWGSATRVGADGTKWDLYEQNLLAEAHIRYGGYGGIGYYHVAGDYIALFSRFIPCGTYEGVYILDPFFTHPDDDLPEAVHSDTHGQSAPIFGLAYFARHSIDAADSQLEASDLVSAQRRQPVRAHRRAFHGHGGLATHRDTPARHAAGGALD